VRTSWWEGEKVFQVGYDFGYVPDSFIRYLSATAFFERLNDRDKAMIGTRLSLCFAIFWMSVFASFPRLHAQSPKEITNSIGMKLSLIPKGTFTMGSPIEEEGRLSDEGQHQVTISKEYYLGKMEVTQGQYEKVMGNNPSHFQGKNIKGDSSNHPVGSVLWDDAVGFCKRLSELPEEKNAGRVYRLPTEAEWEYACRAGSKTAHCGGETSQSLRDYAWIQHNSDFHTHSVGEKKPNKWGLYDMHGNVGEWCLDWYGKYPTGAVTDPVCLKKHVARVCRGDCWFGGAGLCRSACRFAFDQPERNFSVGFRVALNSSGMP